jgi:general stress protein CsbA
MTARIFSGLMGVWLFLSGFAGTHTSTQVVYAAILGALTVAFAALSSRLVWARYASVAIGVVVFLLAFSLYRHGGAPFWNFAITGVAIAIGGLMEGRPEAIQRERELYGRIRP